MKWKFKAVLIPPLSFSLWAVFQEGIKDLCLFVMSLLFDLLFLSMILSPNQGQ